MTTRAATPRPRVVPRRDSRQIRRALAKFIGWGYVAYFVIVVSEMPHQTATVPIWWTLLALTTVFVPGWAMLATSYFDRAAHWTTEVLPLCCGLGYLLVVGSWFLVWTGQQTTNSVGTWLVSFPGLASLALVVGPRPRLSLPHLAVGLSAVQVANSWARSGQYGQLLVTDIAWGMAFSALFVLAGLVAVDRTGKQLDDTYARTVHLAEQAAVQHERETQRKLYGRMIHDTILAVMAQASRVNDDPTVGKDAREALRDWAGQEEAGASKEPITNEDIAARLHKAVAKAHPGAVVVVTGAGRLDADLPRPAVPMRVGIALAEAAGEAVRNARRHAGPTATVTVTAQLDSRPLQVTVVDDGPGFDPATIEPTRYGVNSSIVERMADVDGLAQIYTSPGKGTRIDMRWPKS